VEVRFQFLMFLFVCFISNDINSPMFDIYKMHIVSSYYHLDIICGFSFIRSSLGFLFYSLAFFLFFSDLVMGVGHD
jgi:hypothetical protein